MKTQQRANGRWLHIDRFCRTTAPARPRLGATAKGGLLIVVLGVSVSCESTVELTGTIAVPTEVQQAFSDENKGRLVVQSVYGGQTVYVLCAPSTSELKVPFRVVSFGCVKESVVDALIVPIGTAGEDPFGALPCGTASANVGLVEAKDAVARGRGFVFTGQSPGSCKSGSGTTDITVALVK